MDYGSVCAKITMYIYKLLFSTEHKYILTWLLSFKRTATHRWLWHYKGNLKTHIKYLNMIFSYTIEIRLISYCNPVSMPKSENATWNEAICPYLNKIYIRLSQGNKILLRLIPENQERESYTNASATFRIKSWPGSLW